MPDRIDYRITREQVDAIRREASEFAGIGLYRYLFDGTVLFMDRGAMGILDLEGRFGSPEELTGLNISDLIVYEGPRGYLRSKVREPSGARNLEYPFKTLAGELRWALHSSYLTFDDQAGAECIQAIIKDITDRKRAEIALMEERERLAVTLRSIGDGVISTDVKGVVTLLNKAAEELTGWTQSEAAGRPLTEVFRIINEQTRKPAENPVQRVLDQGSVVGLANHTALIARDGRERVIADSAAPIRDTASRIVGVVLVFRDITAKQRLEQEIQRIDRLESLGVLAGGIAHDFNNLLASILGNLSLSQLYLGQNHAAGALLSQAEKATLRARDLTQQLLTFSRGGAPIRESTRIEAIVEESVSFALSGSRSRCEFRFAGDLWSVHADPGQISQVIHNLALNAEQAMSEGGVITVSGENATIGPRDNLPIKPGRYVRLTVTDTGAGIAESDMIRIFDPYFTTKEHGSGLGLTVCHSIVKNHDGHIQVASRPGEGTVFTVYLGAAEEQPEQGDAHIPETLGGTGRILFMDDEAGLRGVAAMMIPHLGYQVEFAEEGAAAVRMHREALESGRPFDIVVLDLTVHGGMGGIEALRLMAAIEPGIRAIASSGYSSDPIMANCRQHGFKAALPKPYRVMEFSRALLKALT